MGDTGRYERVRERALRRRHQVPIQKRLRIVGTGQCPGGRITPGKAVGGGRKIGAWWYIMDRERGKGGGWASYQYQKTVED